MGSETPSRGDLGRESPLKPIRWSPLHLALLVLAVVLGAAVWTVIAGQNARRRAIASMPAEDRQGLYERTFENLRLCTARHGDFLGDFCRQQAEFILGFPECDDACKEIAHPFLTVPQR